MFVDEFLPAGERSIAWVVVADATPPAGAAVLRAVRVAVSVHERGFDPRLVHEDFDLAEHPTNLWGRKPPTAGGHGGL